MNKLILDGVEYNLSDSLVAKLKEEIVINNAAHHKPGAFDRVRLGDTYYCIGIDGTITAWKEGYDNSDTNVYCNANYCRDEELMKQRALHETLNRLLWRYSETHGGDLPWDSIDNKHYKHYFIFHGVGHGIETTSYSIGMKLQGVVYFKDEATAQAAIEEVVKPFLAEHPEFVW